LMATGEISVCRDAHGISAPRAATRISYQS
jgi:hypothetical protein